MATLLLSALVLFLGVFESALAGPEQGLWDFKIDKSNTIFHAHKSMFKNSLISLKVACDGNKDVDFHIDWLVRASPCANEYVDLERNQAEILLNHTSEPVTVPMPYSRTTFLKGSFKDLQCKLHAHPQIMEFNFTDPKIAYYQSEETTEKQKTDKPKGGSESEAAGGAGSNTGDAQVKTPTGSPTKESQENPQQAAQGVEGTGGGSQRKRRAAESPGTTTPKPTTATPKKAEEKDVLLHVWEDSYYLLVLRFVPEKGQFPNDPKDFSISGTVKMYDGSNYIGAVDWPLLIFYGVMGLVYIFYGIFWLFMLACNWRDLLRVQFWIGGVIFLGMLEKAVFFAEYENVNNTGHSVRGAVIFAELVSCLKRSLARMLVIIISLGYGIVKPRLGDTIHKVLIVGFVYFVLASIEGCSRAINGNADSSTKQLMTNVPVAITDAIICWWIFSALLQTTRTLRLRRNVVKLSLYRHFTNTLIFSVLASIAYMIWFVTQHRIKLCLANWKELWMDEAFWHLLFSIVLFIMMILWRPSANNQRYAFSPLLDAAEDEVDDDQMMNDAFEGMKMRPTNSKQRNGSPKSRSDSKGEDDLKWVEENIPSSLADRVLPALDSDEEIMNTKFEVSKME